MSANGYTARHRSLLKAVSEGRGELVCGRYPNLAVDGRWCDHMATNDLVAADLLRPSSPAPSGSRMPAVLTAAGVAVLSTLAY